MISHGQEAGQGFSETVNCGILIGFSTKNRPIPRKLAIRLTPLLLPHREALACESRLLGGFNFTLTAGKALTECSSSHNFTTFSP